MMQTKLVNRDESAWELGDLAYELNDTIEIGVMKAAQIGIRPGSNGYAAFMTAFSRRVRSKQVAVNKVAQQKNNEKNNDTAETGSAIVLMPDFLRAAS